MSAASTIDPRTAREREGMLLGVEIGGTKIQALVTGADGGEVDRRRFTLRAGGTAEDIRQFLAQAIAEWRTRHGFAAAGVGFGGPVDHRSGRICCSVHVQGWADFPLRDWLQELIAAPVAVENDSNTAALAEARFGAGAGFDPVFYTNSGTGVGGGLVVRGELYHGRPPGESELGHLRLDEHGAIVEDRCSGRALDARVREITASGAKSPLCELALNDPGREARHLGPALAQDDPFAAQIIRDAARTLAFALSHAVHLFNPAAVILGGGVSLIGEPWRAAVAESLPPLLMAAMRPGPQVMLASLGEDVVPRGAIELARRAAAAA